jgi:hypothetical protein
VEHRRSLLIREEGVIDAFVGCRTWRVFVRSGVVVLTSVYQAWQLWYPEKVVRAECKCITTAKLRGLHRCGIYAWREVARPVEDFPSTTWFHSSTFVHGEVLMWGDVRIHQRGYRSSYALPSAIYVSASMPEQTRRNAEMAAQQFKLPTVMREVTA